MVIAAEKNRATGTAGPNLDGIGLLEGLSPGERRSLEKACTWRRYGAQQMILDRDSDTQEICFIVDGGVRVVNFSAGGREISFADVAAGGTVGELAAIDGELRSASVFAREDTVIASLGARPFLELVTTRPKIALSIMRTLTQMVRDSSRRIMELSTLGARNRVHAELLRLAYDNMRDDGTAVIADIPAHAEIAARVGTTRETVARVFGELAREDIVKRSGRKLTILCPCRLADMIEEVCQV